MCEEVLKKLRIRVEDCSLLGVGGKGAAFLVPVLSEDGKKKKAHAVIKIALDKKHQKKVLEEKDLSDALRKVLREHKLCDQVILKVYSGVVCPLEKFCAEAKKVVRGEKAAITISEYLPRSFEDEIAKTKEQLLDPKNLLFYTREPNIPRLLKVKEESEQRLKVMAGFLYQLLATLQTLLKAGQFFHNDLKPDNIRIKEFASERGLDKDCDVLFASSYLLTGNNIIVLTDFDMSEFHSEDTGPQLFLSDLHLFACFLAAEFQDLLTSAANIHKDWESIHLFLDFLAALQVQTFLSKRARSGSKSESEPEPDIDWKSVDKGFCNDAATGFRSQYDAKITKEEALGEICSLLEHDFIQRYVKATAPSCGVKSLLTGQKCSGPSCRLPRRSKARASAAALSGDLD